MSCCFNRTRITQPHSKRNGLLFTHELKAWLYTRLYYSIFSLKFSTQGYTPRKVFMHLLLFKSTFRVPCTLSFDPCTVFHLKCHSHFTTMQYSQEGTHPTLPVNRLRTPLLFVTSLQSMRECTMVQLMIRGTFGRRNLSVLQRPHFRYKHSIIHPPGLLGVPTSATAY